jgi:hypothetical protein
VTTEISHAEGAGAATNEKTVDAPSIGLVPQLIAVLQAFTEGQQLLSLKLRQAQTDYVGDNAHTVDGCLQAQLHYTSNALSYRSEGSGVASKTAHTTPTGVVDLGSVAPSSKVFDNQGLPEPGHESPSPATAPVVASDPALSSMPATGNATEADLPADHSVDTSAPNDRPNALLVREPPASPVNRDYNFFDELDARLAELRKPR